MKTLKEINIGTPFRLMVEGCTYIKLNNKTGHNNANRGEIFFLSPENNKVFSTITLNCQVFTEETVEVEIEEWVNTKEFKKLKIDDKFKWENCRQEPHTKVAIILEQNDQESGYMTSDGKVYRMMKSAWCTTDKVWTLETVIKTIKQWC